MTQWARIEDGLIAEIMPPHPTGASIADCYNEGLHVIECPDGIVVGMTFDGKAFGPVPKPDPASVTAAILATAEARLTDVREAAIQSLVAGVAMPQAWHDYRTAIKAIIANPGASEAAVQWPAGPPMPS